MLFWRGGCCVLTRASLVGLKFRPRLPLSRALNRRNLPARPLHLSPVCRCPSAKCTRGTRNVTITLQTSISNPEPPFLVLASSLSVYPSLSPPDSLSEFAHNINIFFLSDTVGVVLGRSLGQYFKGLTTRGCTRLYCLR